MLFKTYFSARFVLSKKALISLVLSDRSDGKSFDCKARALLDYEKNNEITIYMRRWKSEITEKMYKGWFSEVWENNEEYARFSLWEFKYSKSGIKVRKNRKDDWDDIVYFIPLSMASKLKSQITNIKRIKCIDFDEYMPLDGKFIPDEVGQLLEFWKSIDRDRNEVQIILLGNKISPFCPVFDYFNIDITITQDKVRLYRDDTLAVQIYSNKEHRELRQESKFNSLIKGTPYEEYDTGGILNSLSLELKSRKGFEYLCRFKTVIGEGTIWFNNGMMVISTYKRKDGFIIMDKMHNIVGEKYLCTYGKFPQLLKNCYRRNDMFFESEKAFHYFEKILLKIGSM